MRAVALTISVILGFLAAGCASPAVDVCGGGCPAGMVCDYENNRCVEARPPNCPRDFGRFLSAAVDSSEQIVFSAYAGEYGDLVVGRLLPDGTASCEYVDGTTGSGGQPGAPDILGDDVGLYSSLDLDVFDRPHVAYFDRTHGKLKYARKSSAGWSVVTVPHPAGEDDVYGRACWLRLDSTGMPHIAFWDESSGELEVAGKLSDGRWSLEKVPLDAGRGGWPGSFGGEVGRIVSLVLDSGDREWVAFRDVHDGSLKVAGRQQEGWTVLLVDPGPDVANWLSAALDGDGNMAVAYDDRTTGSMMYAWNEGGVLSRVAVNAGRVADTSGAVRRYPVGQHCSLAFGADGLPRVLYLDAANLDLLFSVADREGGFGAPQVVAFEGATGFYNNLLPGPRAVSCAYARGAKGDLQAQIFSPDLDFMAGGKGCAR